MPYIPPQDRERYDAVVSALAAEIRQFVAEEKKSPAGQLNYAITKLILEVYGDKLPNYTDFNEITGILECAKLEMYRHHVGPYEAVKINENGDVNSPLTRK
jgi:hypothetical protein